MATGFAVQGGGLQIAETSNLLGWPEASDKGLLMVISEECNAQEIYYVLANSKFQESSIQ